MALNSSGGDPCGLLNSSGYPNLWFSSSSAPAEALPKVAKAGVLNTYLGTVESVTITANILRSSAPNSSFRLEKFLSGGANKPALTLEQVVLKTGNTKKSIIDTYVTGPSGVLPNYKYSSGVSPVLSDAQIWDSEDEQGGQVKANPTSILGKLLKDNFLLKSSDIYIPAQLTADSPPIAGTESLIYLYKVSQDNTITASQTARKILLEETNLKFFGAFLAEYCFYRSRYEFLLKLYFDLYTTTPYVAPSVVAATDPVRALFTGTGTGDGQYMTDTNGLTQASYLAGIAYHMACLNTRMTDMQRLLGSISNYYSAIFIEIQNDINANTVPGSNVDLQQKILALNNSAEKAQKYLTETDYRKGVMEYNLEKNRYSNVLLGLYAFLNIAAVAMVIQLNQ